jgi:uncharacterized protein (DUF849 family)
LAEKIIISCAITGSIHTPTMSPYLPLTPDQIATQAIEAAEAGAAILHLHARNPADGHPTPDPEVFLMAMRELGVKAGECWIVEDSLNGIVAGKSAGCVAVGITTTFEADRLSAAGVDVVVESFVELRGMLELL